MTAVKTYTTQKLNWLHCIAFDRLRRASSVGFGA
jgi:hypothetical protein